MTTDFNSLYQSLNLEQQQAVNAIDGPVMVIAGPGTGKTQILAVRILNILKETDTQPHQILCLTYTDAGSSAMRQRLSQFMGADAYKINIHTFHGLCNSIIKDYPEKFSRGSLRVMDDLDRLELLDKLIRQIPADSPLRNFQEDPSYLRKALNQVFGLMQEENLQADFFETGVAQLSQEDVFREALPEFVYKTTTRHGNKGELKRKQYDETITGWKRLVAASKLFEPYQELKKESGLYEFSDMLHWVLNAFRQDPDLLASYQEKYQYILVDEYQDTSGIQNALLYELISFWEDNPNCFVVGDDDQSIYAFQGARVSNMTDFAGHYSDHLTKIVLTQNYRSTQNILDSSKTLIDNNTQRLINTFPELSKDLQAAGSNRNYPAVPIGFSAYKNRFHEALDVCQKIQLLKDAGCPPNEIAVIYAKHKVAEELADTLQIREIPFTLARSIDVLQEPLIKQLQTWLQYLAWELEVPHKGEHLLYEMLHYPIYDISPYEAACISREINDRKNENLKWRNFMAEYLRKNPKPAPAGDDKREALRSLWNHVEEWLKHSAGMNVPQLIQEVIAKGGFLSMALKSEQREWMMEQLHTFLNYAISANQKNPFLTLPEFMEGLNKMKRNDIAIRLERRIGSKSGVILTTAHSSKGLEYKHVFIIGAEQDQWESDRSNSLPYKLREFFDGINHQSNSNEEQKASDGEERRRLFYVAMTRAKETLSISWGNQKIDTKSSPVPLSKFVLEIKDKQVVEETELEKQDLLLAETQLLQRIVVPQLNLEDTEWLRKQLEGFKFSPSTLYDILDCGLKFYFGRIVKVPSAPGAALGYGSAVHDLLHRTLEAGVLNKNWPDEATFVEWFEQELFRQRGAFTRQTYQLKLTQGKEQLPQYYRERIDTWKTHEEIITEKWLEASVDGVIIGGKSDKLIISDNHVTVVDYKTGKPENAEASFKAPTADSLLKGKLPPKYWFQLGLYMIIVNQQPEKEWKAQMAMIDSVEKNQQEVFPIFKQTYSDEDIELLKSYIMKGEEKLKDLGFLKGCGKDTCEWCNFSKETGQVVLPELTIEDAD